VGTEESAGIHNLSIRARVGVKNLGGKAVQKTCMFGVVSVRSLPLTGRPMTYVDRGGKKGVYLGGKGTHRGRLGSLARKVLIKLLRVILWGVNNNRFPNNKTGRRNSKENKQSKVIPNVKHLHYKKQ